MRARILLGGLVCLVLTSFVVSCGGASRATVHDEDVKKVFPWQSGKQKVIIRARPQTTMANTCTWFGSFEEVEVTPQTTFYITDDLDKKFAYTPARSPIRRLAPVKSIEIRWPTSKPKQPKPEEASTEEAKKPAGAEEKKADKDKAPTKQP